jgi:hypothetical protein
MTDYSHLISPKDAAERLGVTRQRLNQIRQEMHASGSLFGTEIAGNWYYTAEELDAYRATHNRKGGRPKSETAQMSPI